MKLNPGKCKEMFINFMQDHDILVNPITMGNQEIECVSNYKLLGVYLNEDLNWNTHMDYIFKKACCKHKVRFYIDYLDKIVLVFIALYHIVIPYCKYINSVIQSL